MGVARDRQPQQGRQKDVARCRVGQVGAAHDLADALRRVVDDDRELIRRHAVGPAHDEVVDHRAALAQQPVSEPDPRAIGAQPQRTPVAGGDPPRPLGVRQRPAGARVAARAEAVRRRRGLADLGPRAEARVHAPEALERRQRVPVALPPLGLAHDRPVPVDPERPQVGALRGLERAPRPLRVEILDAHQEASAGAARAQPRDQRGSQAAEMQRPGRRRRKPPVGLLGDADLHPRHGSHQGPRTGPRGEAADAAVTGIACRADVHGWGRAHRPARRRPHAPGRRSVPPHAREG